MLSASSPYGLSLRALVVSALATGAVLLVPAVHFAYRAPALHVAIETVAAVVALLVAYLVYGRYRVSGRLQELLLVLALATVAVANLPLAALPAALPVTDDLGGWAPVTVRLVGTVLLAAAALTSPAVTTRRGAARRPVLLVAVLVLGLSSLALALGDRLPPAVDPGLELGDAATPLITGHPAVLAAQVVSGVLYAVAAVMFTRQAVRADDELLRWFGAGCVLAATARVHYLLFPSLYSDYVYTGDALRLAFYLMLLAGAAREIRSFWEARAHAAVLEDRRRLARDLHDGLTQELTYIYAQTRHLAKHPEDERAVARVNDAAARAIDEARAAISALTRVEDPAFAGVLRSAVDALADRYDVRAEVVVDDDLALPPDRAEAVLRIVGEAFRNAVRHGHASTVRVDVGREPLTLRVADDGTGFDVTAAAGSGGFGLRSMRERATGQGAVLEIDTQPGGGATVQVLWP